MSILGLEPVIATLVITVVGVGIQVGLGVLQSQEAFNPKRLVSSAIISVFTAFGLVMPMVSAVPADATQLIQFGTFVGGIAAVAGIDTLVKNAGKATLKRDF